MSAVIRQKNVNLYKLQYSF